MVIFPHNDPEGSQKIEYKSSKPHRLWLPTASVLIVLGSIIAAFPASARAGILSFVGTLLAATETLETPKRQETSQTMTLLDASSAGPVAFGSETEVQIVEDSAFLTEAGPMGTAADIASSTPATSDQINTYVVRPGDTLSEIADMFHVSINTILWANDLKRTSPLREGQTLVILPISGVQYTVKKGDTLALIAKKFGGDKQEVMAFNNLETDKDLEVGATIIIPDGEATAPAPRKKVVVIEGGKKKVVYKSTLPSYSGYYIWPVGGGRLTQGIHGHNGIDIGAPVGTPAYAAADGVVLIARTGGYNGGYGNYVVIRHSNGTQTLYGHLSAVLVNPGQSVGQGETIGAVGNTGRSTGPHLHFEVRGATNPFANGRR